MGIIDILRHITGRGKLRARIAAEDADMKRYLIVGLGNMGPEYVGTRHNIGFMIADRLVEACGGNFSSCRYGDMATVKVKNCELLVLKPSTFMNLSGVAVRYWMNKEKLPLENLLVLVDDLALPFGAIRMRSGGSDAGHNGLKNIASELGTQGYARLRFGIGSDFPRGGQIDYVLGRFPAEEVAKLPEREDVAVDAIKAFALSGLSFAMTHYNNK
jgi:PTH1 family peptidyl-tRNA hydrolase